MLLGTQVTAVHRRMTLRQSKPTNLAYTIWVVMYWNGARTGMEVIAAVHKPILQALHRALAAFSVAVAGASSRVTAEFRIVTTAALTAGTTSSASALFFSNYNNIPSFCTKLKNRASLMEWSKRVRDERATCWSHQDTETPRHQVSKLLSCWVAKFLRNWGIKGMRNWGCEGLRN